MITKITQIGRKGMEKVLIVLWGLALLSLISLSILGIFQHEFLGSLAFGFLVTSSLINISTLVSYKCSPRAFQVARATWVGVGVAILGFTLYLSKKMGNDDVDIVLFWTMLVHAFPVSLLVNVLFAGISYFIDKLFSGAIKVGYSYLFIVWFMFFLSGYFQWFKLIPFFLSKFRRAKGGPGNGGEIGTSIKL